LQSNQNAAIAAGTFAVGAAGLGAGTGMGAFSSKTYMSDDLVHPPSYPWKHQNILSSFDAGALRRGFQVYREVCASCHSIELIRWRELVGVAFTKEEALAMAKDTDVIDGPNDQGEMFERPGKLADVLPKPYANAEAGAAANNGALPPDLSLMAKARHNGLDYIFALLTGYCEPPEGKVMMEGLHYNPYFPGGGIAMPPPLGDEGVEYEDGTPATISQQARDVAQFLHWCAEPELDLRNKMAMQYLTVIAFTALSCGLFKRWKWASLKTRQISYVNPSPKLKSLS